MAGLVAEVPQNLALVGELARQAVSSLAAVGAALLLTGEPALVALRADSFSGDARLLHGAQGVEPSVGGRETVVRDIAVKAERARFERGAVEQVELVGELFLIARHKALRRGVLVAEADKPLSTGAAQRQRLGHFIWTVRREREAAEPELVVAEDELVAQVALRLIELPELEELTGDAHAVEVEAVAPARRPGQPFELALLALEPALGADAQDLRGNFTEPGRRLAPELRVRAVQRRGRLGRGPAARQHREAHAGEVAVFVDLCVIDAPLVSDPLAQALRHGCVGACAKPHAGLQ
ncbi:hypothetical protein H6P1_00073 (plasmid) [Variovorax sp. PBL-H6]|nr:hypothetical protein H6P1_00073 [Variovorax sp. PBL-H6]VTU44429.1 hypothetical protein SRS16P1_00829 [Variovorax sp. SRS16]VTU44469.1 hypothetical protein E5P1_00822 [Variovorax sp. PBL-E5]